MKQNWTADDYWQPFDGGRTIGNEGSEQGVISRDEAHMHGARITLETECWPAPFTVTCVVYGLMSHTRYFATEEEAQDAFNEMKVELESILALVPSRDDPNVDSKLQSAITALGDFARRFL